MKAVAVCLKLKEQFAEVPTPEVQNAGDFLETRTFIVSAVNPRTSGGGEGGSNGPPMGFPYLKFEAFKQSK